MEFGVQPRRDRREVRPQTKAHPRPDAAADLAAAGGCQPELPGNEHLPDDERKPLELPNHLIIVVELLELHAYLGCRALLGCVAVGDCRLW